MQPIGFAAIVVALLIAACVAAPFGGSAFTLPGVLQAEKFDEPGSQFSFTTRTTPSTVFRTDTNLTLTEAEGTGVYVTIRGGEWVVYTINVATAGTYDIAPVVCSTTSTAGQVSLGLAFQGIDPIYIEPPYHASCTLSSTTPPWTPSIFRTVTLPAGTLTLNVSANITLTSNSLRIGHIYMMLPTAAYKTHVHPTLQAEDYDEGVYGFRPAGAFMSSGENSTYRAPLSMRHFVSNASQSQVVRVTDNDYFRFTISGWPAGFYHPWVYLISESSSGSFRCTFHVGGMSMPINFMYPTSSPRVVGLETGFIVTQQMATNGFEIAVEVTSGATTMYLDRIWFQHYPFTHKIPGVVEAEAFGFPASDYSIATQTNALSTSFRNDSRIGISGNQYDGAFKINLQRGESVTINLQVETEGTYDVLVVACRTSTTSLVPLNVDFGTVALNFTMYGVPYRSTCSSYVGVKGITDVPRVSLTSSVTSVVIRVPTSVTTQNYFIDRIVVLPTPSPFATHTLPGRIEAESYDNGFSFTSNFPLLDPDANATSTPARPNFMDKRFVPLIGATVMALKQSDTLNFTIASVAAGMYYFVARATATAQEVALVIGGKTFYSGQMSSTGFYQSFPRRPTMHLTLPSLTNVVAELQAPSSYVTHIDYWELQSFAPMSTVPGVVESEMFGIGQTQTTRGSQSPYNFRDDSNITHNFRSGSDGTYYVLQMIRRDNATYPITVQSSGQYRVIIGACILLLPNQNPIAVTITFGDGAGNRRFTFVPVYESGCSTSGPRPFTSMHGSPLAAVVDLDTSVTSFTVSVSWNAGISQQMTWDYLLIDKIKTPAALSATTTTIFFRDYDHSPDTRIASNQRVAGNSSHRAVQILPVFVNGSSTHTVLMEPSAVAVFAIDVAKSGMYNLTIRYFHQSSFSGTMRVNVYVDDQLSTSRTWTSTNGWREMVMTTGGISLRKNASGTVLRIELADTSNSLSTYFEKMDFHFLSDIVDDDTQNVRYAVGTPVPFANYSSARDSTGDNSGNASDFRRGTPVEISTCVGCYSGYAVHDLAEDEELRFLMSNQRAGVYNLSVSMLSTAQTSSTNLGPYWEVWISPQQQHSIRVLTRGALAIQLESQRQFGPWNHTLGPVFLPAGEFTITFRARVPTTTYANNVFFDQFNFVPSRQTFGPAPTRLPFILQAETYDYRVDNVTRISAKDAGSGASFRSDLLHPLWANQSDIYVTFGPNNAAQYMVFIDEGTYTPLAFVHADDPDTSSYRLYISLGKTSLDSEPWSTPISQQIVMYPSKRPNVTQSVSAGSISIGSSGFVNLEIAARATTGYGNISVDRIIFRKNSGFFGDSPSSIPGTLIGYKCDFGTLSDLTNDNVGNFEVRYDRLDTSFDPVLNDAVIVSIQSSELITFTTNIHATGRYEVFLTAEVSDEATSSVPATFALRLNGSSSFGYARVGTPGRHSSLSIGFVTISAAGLTTVTIQFYTLNWLSFYSIAFVPTPATQSVSFLPQGLLTSGEINAMNFDFGGRGIAYEISDSFSTSVDTDNGRSLELINTRNLNFLTYGLYNMRWTTYRFRFPASVRAVVSVSVRGFIPLRFQISDGVLNTVLTPTSTSTIMQMRVGSLAFNAGVEYVLNVSMRENITTSSSSFFYSINFDTSILQPLPTSCYAAAPLDTAQCGGALGVFSTTCGALASDAVPIPNVGTTTLPSVSYCPSRSRGTPVTFPVPIGAGATAGAVLMITQAPILAVKSVGTFFLPGDVWSNGILTVIFSANQYMVYNALTQLLLDSTYVANDITRWSVTSTGFSVTFTPDGTTTVYGTTTAAMALVNCRWAFSTADPLTIPRIDDARWTTFRDYCGSTFTTNDPRSKVEILYSSGRTERVGTLVSTATNLPNYFDGTFSPRAQVLPMLPLSNCGRNSTAPSSVPLQSLTTSTQTSLPVVAIPFTARAGETATAVRYVSYDTAVSLGIAGVAWIKATNSCTTPIISSVPSLASSIRGIEFSGGSIASSSVQNVESCASLCAADASCAAWTFTTTSTFGSLRCMTSSIVPVPEISRSMSDVTPDTAFGLTRILAHTEVHTAYVAEPTLNKPATFPPSAGWKAIYIPGTVPTTLPLRSVSALALAAPTFAFRTDKDYISYIFSGGLTKQCGNAFDPFDRSAIVGELGAPSTCDELDVATCGRVDIPTEAVASQTQSLYIFWSPQVSSTCEPNFVTLFIKGEVLPAAEPVLYEAIQTLSTSLGTRTGLVRDVRRATLGAGYVLREFSSPQYLTEIAPYNDLTLACEFSSTSGYEIWNGVLTAGLVTSCTATYARISDIAEACDAEPTCVGFTTSVATGAKEAPGCLQTTSTSIVRSETATNTKFYSKRRPTSLSCSYNLTGPISSAVIDVTLGDWAKASQYLTFEVNGQPRFRCGGRYGFLDEPVPTRSAQCNRLTRCFDGSLYLAKGDVLTVTIAPAVSAVGTCPYAATVLMSLRGTNRPYVPTVRSLGSRFWRQPSTTDSSHTIRFQTLETIGATFRTLGETSMATGTPNRLLITVDPLLPRFELPSLSNTNTTLTLGGSSTFMCAGRLISNVDGSSSGCDDYHLCSNISGARSSAPFFQQFNAVRGDVTFRHRSRALWQCTTGSSAIATTSGLLVFNGTSILNYYERNHVRTFRAARGTIEQISGNTTLLQALATKAGYSSAIAADLRPWWSEISMQHSFRASLTAASAPVTYLLFDDVATPEATKNRASAEVFCAIDTFVDRGVVQGCAIAVDPANNYVSVKVAQTLFGDSKFTVSVSLGNQQVRCGGGKSFNGVTSSLSGQCGLFLTCFAGRVPAGVSEVFVLFSSPSTTEMCAPAALAHVAQQAVNYTSTQCPLSSLTCHIDNKCIPANSICNGVVDCSDGSDEASCTNWRLVSRNSYPRCRENATRTSNSLLSFDDCRNWAIAYASRLDSYESMGILYQENTHCVALMCMDLEAPALTTIPSTYSGAMFFSFLQLAADFGGCTDDLSCNGKGTVQTTSKPCRCTCRDGYLGDACESRRNMAAMSELLLVTRPPLVAADLLAATIVFENTLAAMRFFSLQVNIRAYEPSRVLTSSTRMRLMQSTPSPTTPEVVSAHYLVELQSSGQNSEKEEALARLTSESEQTALMAQLAAALPNVNITEVAAVSALQISFTDSCTTMTRTIGSTQYKSCSLPGKSNVNVSKVAMLIDYRVKFVGVPSSGVTISGHLGSNGLPVACDSIVDEVDPAATDACQISAVCYFAANTRLSEFVFTPTITSTAMACDGSTVIPVSISYRVLSPPMASLVSIGEPVDVATSRTPAANSAIIGLIICGVAFLICFGLAFQAHRATARMRRAFFGILCSVCIMAGIILLGVYIDGTVVEPTHYVYIDEYRTPVCANSTQPMPHRVSRIAADGDCHRLEVAGGSEGTFYSKVKCAGDAGTIDGLVRVFVGRTVAECEAGELASVTAGACLREETFFPSKTPAELQFMAFNCFTRNENELRWASLNNDFSPAQVPAETVTQGPVPDEVRFDDGADVTIYYRGGALTKTQALRGTSGQVSLVSVSNNNTALVAVGDRVTWENDTIPSHVADPPTAEGMSNVGTIFNGHATSAPLTDSAASVGANRYVGIKTTAFDLGTRGKFTMTFWLRASNLTRGFALVAADNWVDRTSFSSPIVERMLEVLQNGQSSDRLFAEDWHLYYGLYVNGQAGTLSLVYATPQNEGGELRELTWDLNAGNVDAAGDVFSDSWHYLAIGFSEENGRRFAQLFVDGRSSYTAAGWRVCFDRSSFFKPVTDSSDSQVNVYDAVSESTLQGGVLYVGYLNAGIFDLEVHDGFLQQEKIIAMGASGMDRNAVILVDESLLLGQVLLGGFGLFSLITIILLICGIRNNAKMLEGTETAEDTDVNSSVKKRGTSGANNAGGAAGTASKTSSATREGAAASMGASQVRYMVPAVLTTAQTLAIYFTGWRWPARFEVNISWIISWLAFDINLVFPELPALASPAIQVFVAVCVVMILLSMVGNDHDFYVERMSSAGGGALPTGSVHSPKLSLVFKLNKHFTVAASSRDNLTRILFKMWRSMKEETQLAWKEPVPIAAFYKKEVSTERILNSTIVMMRKDNKSSHVRVQISVAADKGDEETGRKPVEAFTGFIDCDLAEARGVCPMHGETLITAIESIHKQVRDSSGRSPYECSYRTPIGTLYRMMKNNTSYNMCPGIEGAHGNFFVCRNDDCNFSVCSECSEMSFGQGLSATMGSKSYELSRQGLLATLGFFVLLIAQSVHMPIMKSALTIIYCSPIVQCDFPSCYDNPSTQFLIFVAFAVIISVTMGLGLVFFLIVNVRRRKLFIEANMPHIFDENGDVPLAQWLGLLQKDTSLLRNVYEPFLFRTMYIQPITLLFKLAVVLPIVFAEPNSLTQLLLASGVEGLQVIFFVITRPFSDHWIFFLTVAGNLHSALQLALMCFHRVAVFKDPSNDSYADYMVLCAAAYLVILVIVLVFAVFAPAIREFLRRRRETEANRKAADEQLRREEEQGGAAGGGEAGGEGGMDNSMLSSTLNLTARSAAADAPSTRPVVGEESSSESDTDSYKDPTKV